MITKIKRIVAELFTPTAKESDNISNKAYRKSVGAIAHCVLSAAIITALVFLSVNYFLAVLIYMSLYTVKEIRDLRKGGGYADFIEDMIATLAGAVFALSMIMPVVAILVGFIVFIIHI